MKEFLKPNDPALWRVAPRVEEGDIGSAALQADIERMTRLAYGNQGDHAKPVMVGLAAPQIGISKRIILVDVAAEGHGDIGDLRVYFNPEIVWHSKEQSEWYEGCYSTDAVCGVVSRPLNIRIQAWTPSGEHIEEEHHGYTARIFQHEIDHLDGKEFVTRITDDKKLHWVEDDQFPEYRDREGWRNWPVLCPRDRWYQIRTQAE